MNKTIIDLLAGKVDINQIFSANNLLDKNVCTLRIAYERQMFMFAKEGHTAAELSAFNVTADKPGQWLMLYSHRYPMSQANTQFG